MHVVLPAHSCHHPPGQILHEVACVSSCHLPTGHSRQSFVGLPSCQTKVCEAKQYAGMRMQSMCYRSMKRQDVQIEKEVVCSCITRATPTARKLKGRVHV